jgi:hypothetical protein
MSLCYIIIMLSKKLNQIIKTPIKIVSCHKEKYIESKLRRTLNPTFFGSLIFSIILFHIIRWTEHHLLCNTISECKPQWGKRKYAHAQTLKKTLYKKTSITNHNILDKNTILISLILNQPSFLFCVWNTFLLDHYQTHCMISHLFPLTFIHCTTFT